MLNYAPPRLGQTEKNGWHHTRDIAVVLATAAGAAASVYYINGRKTQFENVMLGISAIALSIISLSTLITDVIPKFGAAPRN